ncbi:MAG TPA: GldM family protein [Edaphocola sp.]|nr:GldM family protein [Edaphocola sp.]
MKNLLLMGFFCLTISTLFGQAKSITVQNGCIVLNVKQNILYIGIPNTIRIYDKYISCDSLQVKTDNGRITPTGTPCHFTIIPKNFGGCNVLIRNKNNDSSVMKTYFRTLPLPSPQLLLDNKVSGKIPINELKLQLGVAAEIPDLDLQNSYIVKSFSMIIIRKDRIVANLNNIGDRFSEEVKLAINDVEKGDKILVWNIIIIKPGQITEKISPTEYIIE